MDNTPSSRRNFWANLREKAQLLKRDTFAVYIACRDPRVPWMAKIIAACVVAYAFSPIDLIPDFIPVLGYLDDVVLVPLGIALVVKMIPASVLNECRVQAQEAIAAGNKKPKNWFAASIILLVWLFTAWFVARWVWRLFENR